MRFLLFFLFLWTLSSSFASHNKRPLPPEFGYDSGRPSSYALNLGGLAVPTDYQSLARAYQQAAQAYAQTVSVPPTQIVSVDSPPHASAPPPSSDAQTQTDPDLRVPPQEQIEYLESELQHTKDVSDDLESAQEEAHYLGIALDHERLKAAKLMVENDRLNKQLEERESELKRMQTLEAALKTQGTQLTSLGQKHMMACERVHELEAQLSTQTEIQTRIQQLEQALQAARVEAAHRVSQAEARAQKSEQGLEAAKAEIEDLKTANNPRNIPPTTGAGIEFPALFNLNPY